VPARKVIISCAITGSIHTPSMSPHLPGDGGRDRGNPRSVRPRQVAAIVHLHAP